MSAGPKDAEGAGDRRGGTASGRGIRAGGARGARSHRRTGAHRPVARVRANDPAADGRGPLRLAPRPFAGGAYWHLKTGPGPDLYDRIAEPVGDRLFFAGDGTSRGYASTFHGAWIRAMKAADRIAAL